MRLQYSATLPVAGAASLLNWLPAQCDVNGNLKVVSVASSANLSSSGPAYADDVALNNNTITQLPSATLSKGAVIKADSSNSATIRVGKNTASATVGFPLTAGQSIGPIEVADLSQLYAFAAVAGQKLNVFAV